MANLYDINEEILKCVDMETGEIIDEEKLSSLQLEFNEKVEGIACWIKNLLSDAQAIKEEVANLSARKKSYENKAESLKKYLSSALDGQKFKTSKVSISYRKSESVDVQSINSIPEEYLKFTAPTADKTAIKKAIKSGEVIPGCELVENQNIQIK